MGVQSVGQLLPAWGKCSNFAVHKKRIGASSAMPSLCLRCGSALLAEEEQRNNMRTATALACIFLVLGLEIRV